MTLRLDQSARRAQKSTWLWEVWLAGSPGELAAVREVEYRLHPTFPNPVVTIKKGPDFRLRSSGWGEFELGALVRLHDGEQRWLERWIRLVENDSAELTHEIKSGLHKMGPGGPVASEAQREVFVSYSAADTGVALGLRNELAANNITMVTMDDISVGTKWQAALETQLKAADAMVVIVSDQASPWLQQEVDTFNATNKPVIPIYVHGAKSIVTPEAIRAFKGVPISGSGNLSGVGAAIFERLKAMG